MVGSQTVLFIVDRSRCRNWRLDRGIQAMTILVTGGTGTIGSQVVQQLANEGAQVRALALDTSKLKAPAGV
jgi:FlaA1/EpsC-like NDP-sugar epimerase